MNDDDPHRQSDARSSISFATPLAVDGAGGGIG